MRALSARQAKRCEEATEPRCRCRCGGAGHGAKRARAAITDPHAPAFYDKAELKRKLQTVVERDPRQLEIA